MKFLGRFYFLLSRDIIIIRLVLSKLYQSIFGDKIIEKEEVKSVEVRWIFEQSRLD